MGQVISFGRQPPTPDDVLHYFFSQINARYPALELDLTHAFVRRHYVALSSLALAYLHTAPSVRPESPTPPPDIRALFFAETVLQMLAHDGLVNIKPLKT